MKYKIKELAPDLFEIEIAFWVWSDKQHLIQALVEICNRGKFITHTRFFPDFKSGTYLVTTMDKQG